MKSLAAISFALIACTPSPGVKVSIESGSIAPIHSMMVSRAVHTSTLLPDGTVLIAGGFDSGGHYLASAEIYDPGSGSFSATGSMTVGRVSYAAILLPNGKVLIAGGYDGTYLDEAELYDPVSGQFSQAGQLTTPREGPAVVLLRDGKVLIAGGVGTNWTFLSSAELYNPETNLFTATGGMTVPRASHTATLLRNGKVLIAGGHKDRHAAIVLYSSAELYDPLLNTFTATGSMTIRRHKHDATMLTEGKVLISGGSDERDEFGAYAVTELYDSETEQFTAAANMNASRYKHTSTSVLLMNGKVLLIGGAKITELYNPATNTFGKVKNSLGVTRLFAATTLLPDGKVLFTGGYGPDIAASAQAWIFTP